MNRRAGQTRIADHSRGRSRLYDSTNNCHGSHARRRRWRSPDVNWHSLVATARRIRGSRIGRCGILVVVVAVRIATAATTTAPQRKRTKKEVIGSCHLAAGRKYQTHGKSSKHLCSPGQLGVPHNRHNPISDHNQQNRHFHQNTHLNQTNPEQPTDLCTTDNADTPFCKFETG